ncbi:MAG: TIGR00159 family protein [Deltaproteobacteria bacterium HGW-Deltaproteobacteria-11]|nr:MAG: TIGR00159 family protein [Deltaproteobacteria bacterium HGW-Deltaproteobacteria-11]
MFPSVDLFYLDKPSLIGSIKILIDVGLVAFIVYRFFLFLRGTRASLMLMGLLLVLAAAWGVSYYMDLFTIQFLLSNFLNYFFLFLIIIFQVEIRRLLTHVGSEMSIFSGGDSGFEALDELLESLERMAAMRTGAIIVLERSAIMDDTVFSGGEVIDALVSKELIWSLFHEGSENPLHDGAIVIRKNRVYKAGVILPMSDNKQLDSRYGTRHRAALGLTENTDALTIVVSEERGTISLCDKGLIVPMENTMRLRNELLRLMRRQNLTPARWWRKSKTSGKG